MKSVNRTSRLSLIFICAYQERHCRAIYRLLAVRQWQRLVWIRRTVEHQKQEVFETDPHLFGRGCEVWPPLSCEFIPTDTTDSKSVVQFARPARAIQRRECTLLFANGRSTRDAGSSKALGAALLNCVPRGESCSENGSKYPMHFQGNLDAR
jgi:hypothetical protein